MTKTTINYYDDIVQQCRDIFLKKNNDYGSIWRNMRTSTLTDEILIKIKRIRTIDEKKEQKIDEPIVGEFMGIINYSVMALIQIKEGANIQLDLDDEQINTLFLKYCTETKELMLRKNHDYGEAWREMRISSIEDVIYAKVLRIKKMEDLQKAGGKIHSEGPFSNYQDIINYSMFALIKMDTTN